ncbi:MAG: glycosyltransferase family 39 protein [Acidobacteriota bacterium]
MTARYPVSYIVEWCRSLEIQPPYFYFAMKAVMAAGSSDFTLRCLFTLAGLATVAATYRLGLLIAGPAVGLGAAALIAFNPQFLWLSRTLRIYPLLHLGYAVSLILFYQAFARGRGKAEIGLYVVNLVMLLLHYSAVLMVGAQFGVLLVWSVIFSPQVKGKALVRFILASLLSFAPSAPFFFGGMVGGGRLVAQSSYHAVAMKLTRLMGENVAYFGDAQAGWIVAALILLGASIVLIHNRKAASLLALSVLLPCAAIVVKRYDSHLFPAHVSFLVIPVSVLSVAGLSLFRKSWIGLLIVMAFAVSSLWWTLGPANEALYAIDSHDRRIFRLGVFKQIAKVAPAIIGKSPVLCPDLTQYNAINWYLNQYSDPNPLVNQRLERNREWTDLLFWCGFDNFGHLAKDKDSFLARYPGIQPLPPVDTIRPYQLRIARKPLTVTEETTTALRLDAAPEHFYRDVATVSKVMISPYFGNGVMPTANEDWGSFEYDIINDSPVSNLEVSIIARYANRGRESRVVMDYRFDGGAWRQAFASTGPDLSQQRVVRLESHGPWRVVTVRCRLWCASLTPATGGSNLSTLVFKGIDVYLCSPSQVNDRDTHMAIDVLPQGFPVSQGPKQQPVSTSNVNFHEESEFSGWGYYTPANPDQPGEICISLQHASGALVFYPRAMGPQSTLIAEVGGQVNTLRGLQSSWTPLGLVLPLPESDGQSEVRFRLEGRGAQLWSHSGQLVFFMPGAEMQSKATGP